VLRSAWNRNRDAVLALEERADATDDEATRKLLESYRKVVFEGSVEALTAFDGRLTTGSAAGRGSERRARPIQVLNLGGRARKLNRALQPDALDDFDRVAAKYGEALSKGGTPPAGLTEDLRLAQARMVQPEALLPRVLPAAIASVLLVPMAIWMLASGPASGFEVSLISTVGDVTVTQILRDGQEVAELSALTVSEVGTLVELESGSYVLKTGGDVDVTFDVPRQRSVVLTGDGTDFASGLMQTLDVTGGTP
jgi:hypothetical protein